MHVKDLHLSKQEREERGLFLRQKDKKAELVPKQNVNILKHCLSPFCLRVEKVCSSFQVIAYKCNYAIASSSHDICKHYLVKSKYTLVLSDVVKRPLKHVSAILRTVQSSSCTSLFAPPPQCPPTSSSPPTCFCLQSRLKFSTFPTYVCRIETGVKQLCLQNIVCADESHTPETEATLFSTVVPLKSLL